MLHNEAKTERLKPNNFSFYKNTFFCNGGFANEFLDYLGTPLFFKPLKYCLMVITIQMLILKNIIWC